VQVRARTTFTVKVDVPPVCGRREGLATNRTTCAGLGLGMGFGDGSVTGGAGGVVVAVVGGVVGCGVGCGAGGVVKGTVVVVDVLDVLDVLDVDDDEVVDESSRGVDGSSIVMEPTTGVAPRHEHRARRHRNASPN
jgi:hypothetical protein